MSDDAKRVIKFLAEVAVTFLILWYSTPGKSPLAPIAWRTGARGAQLVADRALQVSLYCRSRYWKAVRP